MERFRQYASGERGLNVNVSNNIDPSKLVAAMVKAAYLGLFFDWGYRYPLLPQLDWVRKGIRRAGPERECFEQLIMTATDIHVEELAETPTRLSFEATCNGIDVACSIINGVLGPDAFWVVLPPMFNMTTGNCTGLQRAVESIRGKSLTISFDREGPAVIREKT